MPLLAQTSKLLKRLAMAFPRMAPPMETVAVYCDALADLDEAALEAAVRHIIATGSFYPSVGEIRARAAELVLALPSEADALAAVKARIRGDGQELHPLVERALDAVGRSAFTDGKPGVTDAAFLRIYTGLRAQVLEARNVTSAGIGTTSALPPALAAIARGEDPRPALPSGATPSKWLQLRDGPPIPSPSTSTSTRTPAAAPEAPSDGARPKAPAAAAPPRPRSRLKPKPSRTTLAGKALERRRQVVLEEIRTGRPQGGRKS